MVGTAVAPVGGVSHVSHEGAFGGIAEVPLVGAWGMGVDESHNVDKDLGDIVEELVVVVTVVEAGCVTGTPAAPDGGLEWQLDDVFFGATVGGAADGAAVDPGQVHVSRFTMRFRAPLVQPADGVALDPCSASSA